MAESKQKYAAIIVVNVKDDQGVYARGIEAASLDYTESIAKKRVNVMRKDRRSSGFTNAVKEVSGSLEIPMRVWSTTESYDFKKAMDEGRELTLFGYRDGVGSGTLITGVVIEELAPKFNADGEAMMSIKWQGTDAKDDLTRRSPF